MNMSLPQDLLRQALELANLDPRRPRQANLRRAISSAYYSLFHLLSSDAAQRLAPARPLHLKYKVGRSFQHGEMKDICGQFGAAQTSQKLLDLLGTPVSPALQEVARAFVNLQARRQIADYDLMENIQRAEALSAIGTAQSAFAFWRSIRSSEEANVFLAALAFGKRWDR